MKSGSGGGSSLAIAERQKPAPSCVAALFQMFARRKLFSSSSKKSKLLPPVRAQKFSPGRPAGGGEKTSAAKMRPLLLDSADYSRGKTEGNGTGRYPQPVQDRKCCENEMCAPGVVARLMGLSSMPAVSHQRPTKAIDSSGLGDHRNSGPQDWSSISGSIYTSPQKQQKTGQGIDDRQKDNGSQFSAPDARLLWPRRHAHKVASPVKSPRSMSSRNKARLIEAAVKVLEPGLQSRNRRLSRQHAYLEYPCSTQDCVPAAAAAVLHNLPDQFLRDMPDVDAQRLGAHNFGDTSLHNSTSNKWIEEDSRKSIQFRRSDQNVPCQIQPEGNGRCFPISSSEKAGFEDSAKRTSNCVAVTNQDGRKNQPRNISRESARRGPLKQNNLKQNTLPEACIEADPGYIVQRNKHRSGEQNVTHTAQDFVSLNKRITGSKSLRSKRKELDRFGELHTSAENTNMSTKGRRSSSLHSDTSNKLKLKPVTPKAMEKDMIIAKGAGLVSEKPKAANQNCAKSDFQRQTSNVSRSNRKSGIVSLSSSSPVKADATSLCGDNATTRTGTAVQGSPVGACLKGHSRKDCQNTSPQRGFVFREVLQGTSSVESTESVFFNQNELKNRDAPGGRAACSFFEKKGAVTVREEFLSDAPLWQRNSVDTVTYGFRDNSKPVHFDDSHKKHEADAKGCSPSPSTISRSRNKKSPTSILQSKYADDAFTPGIPLHTAELAFIDCHPTETCTPAAPTQDATAERSSRCSEPNYGNHYTQPSEPAVQDSELNHPGEVTTTVELLLTNVRSSARLKSKEPPSKTFLLRTIESALATLTPGSKQAGLDAVKAKEARSLRSLALDFVWDCLDSMCTQLCDSGYRSFTKLGVICTEERLAAEVREEIGRCSGMAGRGLDELAVSEVERAVEDGMGYMVEAFQIGAQIERELVQELVDEIGLDMFKLVTS